MLNEREMDVLNILWANEEPMMVTDIVNQKNGLTQSTVTAVLRKLLKEELVEVAGVTHSGRVLSRIYKPTEKSRKVIMTDFLDQYNRFCEVIRESEICASILTSINDKNRTKEEAKKLFALLE